MPVSPLLFSLFVNDLMKFKASRGVIISQYCMNGLLFADDVKSQLNLWLICEML